MSNQTTFRRAKHDKEHPFVMISKNMFRDKNISFKAKGLLGYLLCLPDNWKVNPKQIAQAMDIGSEQIYSGLRELIKAGYCRRIDEKDETGRFTQHVYEFSEEAIFQKPQYPDLEKPKVAENISKKASPLPQNPDVDRCHIKDKEGPIKEKEEQTPLPPKGDGGKISHGSHVKFKPGEYEALCKANGKRAIDILIEEMNDYCLASKPKGYKDYAAAMRQWLRKRKPESNILEEKEVVDERLKELLKDRKYE